MRLNDIERLKEALRLLLKKQKKTYDDLAAHLGVSLPTVKRIMSKEEITLSRFLEICDWLGVGLADLEVIARHDMKEHRHQFTIEQERFLSRNPEYLSFLARLYNETPQQIQKTFHLTDKSLNLYLIRLEKLDLIIKKGFSYRLVHADFPTLRHYGELLSAQYRNLIESGSGFFKKYTNEMIVRKNPEQDKGSLVNLTLATMSRKNYLEWNEEYKKVIEKFYALSALEEKIPKLKDKRSIVLMHLAACVEENNQDADSLKNMFGAIRELTEKPR